MNIEWNWLGAFEPPYCEIFSPLNQFYHKANRISVITLTMLWARAKAWRCVQNELQIWIFIALLEIYSLLNIYPRLERIINWVIPCKWTDAMGRNRYVQSYSLWDIHRIGPLGVYVSDSISELLTMRPADFSSRGFHDCAVSFILISLCLGV